MNQEVPWQQTPASGNIAQLTRSPPFRVRRAQPGLWPSRSSELFEERKRFFYNIRD